MVNSDMEVNQLEAYLTSLCNKKNTTTTTTTTIMEEHKGAIMKFWNTSKHKLHTVMVDKCRFNNAMTSFKWRVDIDYKDNTQSSEPKVIFEIGVTNTQGGGSQEKILFESDADTLDQLIAHTQ